MAASGRGNWWYRLVRWTARVFGFGPLGGVRTLHPERVPMAGSLLVAPVHLSWLDPPLVACAQPRALCFMAKEQLFKPPIFGPLIRSVGAFPVRRGTNDTESIKRAIEMLREGRAVLVFPEGTRGDGRQMLPIAAGVSLLARRTGATVLPIGISGTEKAWPKGRKLPRRARLTVAIGHPFSYDEVAGADDREGRERFAQELGRRIAEACREAGLPIIDAPSSRPRSGSPAPETASADSNPEPGAAQTPP